MRTFCLCQLYDNVPACSTSMGSNLNKSPEGSQVVYNAAEGFSANEIIERWRLAA